MDIQTAINALSDIAVHQFWGTPEYEAFMTALDAMSYQKATRPYERELIPFSEKKFGRCPRCGYVVFNNENSCDNCGQKLMWEE